MKKYGKVTGILLIVIAVIMSIFISTQIPVVNPKIKDLPLAIVNQDKTDMTKAIVENLKKNSQINDKLSIKWEEVATKDQVVDKMNNGEYYGALVIPENYTKGIASLSTSNAQAPEFKIVVNQGKNNQLSPQVTQILSQIANKIGNTTSSQIIKKAEATNQPLPAKIAENLINPVKVQVENINTTGDFSSAPSVFFSPIWISSLIGSVLLFILSRKEINSSKEKIVQKSIQLGIIGLSSVVVGFLSPYLVEWILGVSVDKYVATSAFLSVATFGFMTLIFGTVSWLGLAGIPLFVLLLFFALPLLSLAPEMLSSFYTDWVLPWLPMRMLYDGVKNILFFGQDFWNGATKELIYVVVIGVALILLSILKKDKVKNNF